MNTPPPHLAQLLAVHQEELLRNWVSSILPGWRKRYPQLIAEDEFRAQSWQLFEEIRRVFSEHPDEAWEPVPESRLVTLLREISSSRAKQGVAPNDTSLYMMALKRLILALMKRELAATPVQFIDQVGLVEHVLDRLALLVYEVYVETRERIIAQQSLSLLELSTPVVRLWDRIVLLPLIGVIDTLRARQITERLLEAIATYEARVAILDVSGVPVLDTSVAGHMMKTVQAAEMLGARVVMTGISPEGAQTLVKLGVDFSSVVTRATLRAGVAEALLLTGRKVASIGSD